MPYIYDGMTLDSKGLRDVLEEEYNLTGLAIEFFDLNYGPVTIGPLRLDCASVLWTMIGNGSLNEDSLVGSFMTAYTTAIREGTTGKIELPYDLDGLDVRYVRDGAVSKSRRSSCGSKPRVAPRSNSCKSKAPAKSAGSKAPPKRRC